MKYIRLIFTATALGAALGACASPPSEIPSTYVSAKKFEAMDCDALDTALESNAERASVLRYQLQSKANVDAAQASIGVLLWPMFLFLEGGDGDEAAEYAKLKGERTALVSAVKKKECDIDLDATDMFAQPCDSKTKDCPPALVRRMPMLK